MFKYSVLIVVEKKYIKCNIWRVAVRPSYISDARFLKVNDAASSSDSIVWNDGWWNESFVANLEMLFWHYFRGCQENHEILASIISPDLDSNL
jgi:hypothetical protein